MARTQNVAATETVATRNRGRQPGTTFATGYDKAIVTVEFSSKALEDGRKYFWKLFKAVGGKKPDLEQVGEQTTVYTYFVRPTHAATFASRARSISMKGAVRAKVLQRDGAALAA